MEGDAGLPHGSEWSVLFQRAPRHSTWTTAGAKGGGACPEGGGGGALDRFGMSVAPTPPPVFPNDPQYLRLIKEGGTFHPFLSCAQFSVADRLCYSTLATSVA